MSNKKDDSFEDWILGSNLSMSRKGSSNAARKALGNIARQLESGRELTENTKLFLIEAFIAIEKGESADKAFLIASDKVGRKRIKNFSRNQYIVIMMNHYLKEDSNQSKAADDVELRIQENHPEWGRVDSDYIRKIYRENK